MQSYPGRMLQFRDRRIQNQWYPFFIKAFSQRLFHPFSLLSRMMATCRYFCGVFVIDTLIIGGCHIYDMPHIVSL